MTHMARAQEPSPYSCREQQLSYNLCGLCSSILYDSADRLYGLVSSPSKRTRKTHDRRSSKVPSGVAEHPMKQDTFTKSHSVSWINTSIDIESIFYGSAVSCLRNEQYVDPQYEQIVVSCMRSSLSSFRTSALLKAWRVTMVNLKPK